MTTTTQIFVCWDKTQKWDISEKEKERNRCHYRINYRGHYLGFIMTSIENTIRVTIAFSCKTLYK